MPSGRIEHGTIDSPEIVTEVNDSGQWEIKDTDGNVIARFDQDQVTNLFSDLFDAANSQTVYDGSTQEVPADVNNENTTAQVVTLDQQADDGTNRVLIKRADGTNMAEIYSDGTDTIINPISGAIDVNGALSADSATITNTANVGALTAGQADITGETYIEANLTADVTGETAGTWTNIVDNEQEDNLNEFDTGFEFNPGETGKYTIIANTRIDPGADGDLILLRLRNVTDGDDVEFMDGFETGGSGTTQHLTGVWSGTLTNGKVYAVEATDNTSSYGVISGLNNNQSTLRIIRGVVHP